MRKLILPTLVIILALIACGSTDTSSTSTQTVQSTASVTWSQGAIQIFHSTDPLNPGSHTDSFTVPSLWRLAWFCQPGSDPTQAFFGIDIQHADTPSNVDGETPLQTDCNSAPHGFTEEHVGGNVTLQIIAGTGTSWDVYVQTPM